jgi:hypothetical protein
MRDSTAWLILCAFALMSAAAFLFLLNSCGPSLLASMYGAELQGCVADASTREQSDECTDRVAAKYGRDGKAAR